MFSQVIHMTLIQLDITTTAPDIYFEKFDEVKVNVCEVTQFNEAVNISTTYLGRDIKDPLVMKAPFSFGYSLPFTAQCHIEGTLQNGRTTKVLFVTGVTKSYLSRRCYNHNPHFTFPTQIQILF